MKDILLIMSDQHGQAYTQMEEPRLDTPELMRIAADGVMFGRCYCNAPLCVPSRMSFLSGKLPSELGIFNNDSTLPADVPTIAHALGAAGYRTVLAGRMHFKGEEQNHGFDERLVGDITSQYWGTGGAQRADFGDYVQTTNRKHCLDMVGGGCSPVMAYDAAVFDAALGRLKEERREPLFMVVGFYGPHFPFVCEPELYKKYKERFKGELPPEEPPAPEPEYADSVMECGWEKKLHCKAAYCGQVEKLDWYVGRLYDAFCSEREDYVFLYTSDHGEQLGKRGLFGKQALYEDAVRVPLIMAGSGVPGNGMPGEENLAGRAGSVYSRAVSLLDVSAAILAFAGMEASWHGGGAALAGREAEKPAVIQQVLEHRGELILAEAVVRFPYKAVRYQGDRIKVYHLEQDPEETSDIAAHCAGFADTARQWMLGLEERHRVLMREKKKRAEQNWLDLWGKRKKPVEWATVKTPANARRKPVE